MSTAPNATMREMRGLIRHLWKRGDYRTALLAVLTMPRYAMANGWWKLTRREVVVVHVDYRDIAHHGPEIARVVVAELKKRAMMQYGDSSRWADVQ